MQSVHSSGGPDPLSSPQVSALLRNPAALKALLGSPEAKRLIQMLQDRGDLPAAASAAKAGNYQQLQALLGRLQTSPDGQQALHRLEEKLQG